MIHPTFAPFLTSTAPIQQQGEAVALLTDAVILDVARNMPNPLGELGPDCLMQLHLAAQ